MNTEPEQHPRLHLFTLRVWEETLGAGKVEWRGRVQEISTGEALFFRDWPGLITTLQRLIDGATVAQDGSSGQFQHPHEDDK